MNCEVLRVLQLSNTAIVPVSYHVPRKVRGPRVRASEGLGGLDLTGHVPICHQAVEFHEDLFPDTAGCVPASDPHAWWAGSNQQVGPRPGWPLLASNSPMHGFAVQLSANSAAPCPPIPYLLPASNASLFPQVQKVSLHPGHRPHPSFTSCLVPPMEPSPDAAQPAETPVGDMDPSVSAWAVRLSSPSRGRSGCPESKLASVCARLLV